MRTIRKWPAASTVILAFLVTYAIGLPLMFLFRPIEASLGLREELLSLFIMKWGPTIGGFIVIAAIAGRRGFGVWLRQLLRWRVRPGFYAFIYLGGIAIFAASIFLAFLFSPPPASAYAGSQNLPSFLMSYAGEIVYITLTNGEETGWRFVLLGLLMARMNLFAAVLLSGSAWVLWHLPMYLLTGQGLTMFAPFVCIGLGLSVLLSWLYKATNSLLLPILFHGMVNATTYSFEHQFPQLNEALKSLGATGEWTYAAVLAPIVLAVLALNRQMFFDRVHLPPGEDWVRMATVDRAASKADKQ